MDMQESYRKGHFGETLDDDRKSFSSPDRKPLTFTHRERLESTPSREATPSEKGLDYLLPRQVSCSAAAL